MTTGMTFSEYEHEAEKTALYPRKGKNIFYPTLGLVGEAGEVADKVSKIIRDDNEVITPERRASLIKELGDVLWYLAAVSGELGVSLDEIAKENLHKLASRQERGTLHGVGDDR